MNSSIIFCGDIMPGGVLPYQNTFVNSEVLRTLNNASIRVGTLEAAIGEGLPFDESKMSDRCNIIYARDQDITRIINLGINIVSLANNHVFDLGIDGFKNTIKILKENKIQYCGAGSNIAEARKPIIIKLGDYTLAILAYCMFGSKYIGQVPIATEVSHGVNPLIMEHVVTDIKAIKSQCDYVFVMPHWGREYDMCPLDECITMAHEMIDAGADAIVGSHPHIVQPLVKYKGKNIAFSLGNFLFPDFYMKPPRPIWYPSSIDETKNIENVIGYPFPINKPTLQIWNNLSRIGLAVEFKLNHERKISLSKHFVKLTNQNILQPLGRNLKYKLRLFIFLLITKYRIFNHLYKSYLSIVSK